MKPSDILDLDRDARQALWKRLAAIIESYMEDLPGTRVAPELDPKRIRGLLEAVDFSRSLPPLEAVDFIDGALRSHQVHTPHPRYFGLFNPAPAAMGIAADTLCAAFNPQLAAWSHSPFAVEAERHLVRAFGRRFGYDAAHTDGTFASGGAEANHTAILTALVRAFPETARGGLRAVRKPPIMYVSSESHHSFLKAARACGLGTEAVRQVPVDAGLRMDVRALQAMIAEDREAGRAPFMVAATAGTTSAGVVDPLDRIADAATRAGGIWLHVDAAWGGAAVFAPGLKDLLEGIDRADSITFDAHKWLSVPMGAGIYITRHTDILGRTFGIAADYMPHDAAGMDVVDPYHHSIQWSRRFIGLKVLMALAVAGWEGYSAVIQHQARMGDLLREELRASGWTIMNETRLPVVCFVDDDRPDGRSERFLEAVAQGVVASGQAWLSTVRLGMGARPALRACITNYRTEKEDVRALVRVLHGVRTKIEETA